MATLRTNDISLNFVDFLEAKQINQEKFRELWQSCEWENKVKVELSNDSFDKCMDQITEKLKVGILRDVSLESSKIKSICLYSRFVLGKDIVINLSIEKEESVSKLYFRMRSQNMSLVVQIGELIKQIYRE